MHKIVILHKHFASHVKLRMQLQISLRCITRSPRNIIIDYNGDWMIGWLLNKSICPFVVMLTLCPCVFVFLDDPFICTHSSTCWRLKTHISCMLHQHFRCCIDSGKTLLTRHDAALKCVCLTGLLYMQMSSEIAATPASCRGRLRSLLFIATLNHIRLAAIGLVTQSHLHCHLPNENEIKWNGLFFQFENVVKFNWYFGLLTGD